MTEPPADCHDVDAGVNKLAGVGVAKRVEADLRYADRPAVSLHVAENALGSEMRPPLPAVASAGAGAARGREIRVSILPEERAGT